MSIAVDTVYQRAYDRAMDKETVIQHFGSQSKLAAALRISRQAVNKWPDLIPEAAALRLEKLTEGALEYDETLYR